MRFMFAGVMIAGAVSMLGAHCNPPTAAQVEAGRAEGDPICKTLTGLDTSGTLQEVCPTLDELATIAEFILASRQGVDASVHGIVQCQRITPDVCATSQERAAGALLIKGVRARKDGGK